MGLLRRWTSHVWLKLSPSLQGVLCKHPKEEVGFLWRLKGQWNDQVLAWREVESNADFTQVDEGLRACAGRVTQDEVLLHGMLGDSWYCKAQRSEERLQKYKKATTKSGFVCADPTYSYIQSDVAVQRVLHVCTVVWRLRGAFRSGECGNAWCSMFHGMTHLLMDLSEGTKSFSFKTAQALKVFDLWPHRWQSPVCKSWLCRRCRRRSFCIRATRKLQAAFSSSSSSSSRQILYWGLIQKVSTRTATTKHHGT